MAFRHGFEVRRALEQLTSVAEVLEEKHSSRRVNLSRQSIKHRIILRRKKKRGKKRRKKRFLRHARCQTLRMARSATLKISVKATVLVSDFGYHFVYEQGTLFPRRRGRRRSKMLQDPLTLSRDTASD